MTEELTAKAPELPLIVQGASEEPDTDISVNPARWTFQRLAREIKEFEDDLDPTDEVGLRLVGTPMLSAVHVEDVGYWGPDLIIFYGRNEHGKAMKLVQHLSQLSFFLTAVPSTEPEPRRIGFHLTSKAAEGEVEVTARAATEIS